MSDPGGGSDTPISATGRDRATVELVRESTTMALYVGLSLLAVLLALPDAGQDNRVEAGLTVLVTGLGLVLAHHLAFRMSARLFNEGRLAPEHHRALRAQAIGGITTAVVAAAPVFLLGEDPGELVAELLLLGFVATIGWRTARMSVGRLGATAYVGVVALCVVGVLVVKLAVGH